MFVYHKFDFLLKQIIQQLLHHQKKQSLVIHCSMKVVKSFFSHLSCQFYFLQCEKTFSKNMIEFFSETYKPRSKESINSKIY